MEGQLQQDGTLSAAEWLSRSSKIYIAARDESGPLFEHMKVSYCYQC